MSASEQKLPSQRWKDKKDALWARPYSSKTPIFENRIYEKREMKLGLKGILAAGNNSRGSASPQSANRGCCPCGLSDQIPS